MDLFGAFAFPPVSSFCLSSSLPSSSVPPPVMSLSMDLMHENETVASILQNEKIMIREKWEEEKDSCRMESEKNQYLEGEKIMIQENEKNKDDGIMIEDNEWEEKIMIRSVRGDEKKKRETSEANIVIRLVCNDGVCINETGRSFIGYTKTRSRSTIHFVGATYERFNSIQHTI